MNTQANSARPSSRHLTKNLRPALALACALSAASLLHAETTWTGAEDNEFLKATNWSNGAPNNTTNLGIITSGNVVWAATTNPHANALGKHITQNGGTFTVNSSATRVMQDGGQGPVTYNLNGGTFNFSNANGVNLGDNTSFNFNGGSLTSTGGGGLRINSASAAINIYSNLTTNVAIANAFGKFTVSAASFQAGSFALGANNANASLLLTGGASMNLTGNFTASGNSGTTALKVEFSNGTNSFSAASWSGNGLAAHTTFDFASSASGSSITLSSGAWNEATWITKWNSGLLKVDGANSGSFSDYFTVSGNTLTFSTVPEPSSFALIGAVGALAFAGTRRRRRAL